MLAVRERSFPAAVIQHDDPRAASVARAVPAKARIVTSGEAIVGYWHTPARTKRPVPFNALRRSQISRLVASRFQAEPPNPDEARKLARIFADHASFDEASRWAAKWCITLDEDERDEIIEQSFERPTYWSADDLALLLGVTRDERDRLKLTTVGAVGFTKRQRTIARKLKDRDRKRAARAAAQFARELSQEQAAPWRAAGISRRAFFLRKKKAASNVAATNCTKPVRTDGVRTLRTKAVQRAIATSADRVLLAIRDGGQISVAAIAARTGLNHRVVRPLLSRLLKAKKIVRVARGTYRIAAKEQATVRPASKKPKSLSVPVSLRHLSKTIFDIARPIQMAVRGRGRWLIAHAPPTHALTLH